MSTLANRLGNGLGGWTPAQVAAAAFGAWWTLNGVLALTTGGDASATAPSTHGEADLFGISIAVNGWHGFFHLLTGLGGLAVCAWPRASRLYALAAGGLYLFVATWGLVGGGSPLEVIYVDTLGSVVHAVEGTVVLVAGIASNPLKLRSGTA